ncbi:MAG TPA: hypothetical protein VNT51_00110, partial [Miltoncostaeaceae bacterium]|nr:hypothetical protein [Miltoncostaeaceae bacterium]
TPAEAGVLAALGLVTAGRRHDLVQTVMLPLDRDGDLAAALRPLVAGARDTLPGAPVSVAADCRYRGQGHALTVTWDPAGGAAGLRAAFDAQHRRRYGADAPDRPAEVVSLRVSAEAPGAHAPDAPAEVRRRVPGPAALPMAGATAWIPAGWTARVRADGTVEAHRGGGGDPWTG